MILICLFNTISVKSLSILDVPVVPVVTAASVIVAPLLKGVVPLLDGHHLVEGIDVNIGPVTGSDVDQLFGHPICLVDHLLFGPVYFVVPPADHLPGGVFDFIRNLTWFDVNTLCFIGCIPSKCRPVFNIFFVDEIFTPSDGIVSSP